MNKDPLHGITLKAIVTELEQHYGWQQLGTKIKIQCFIKDPSINSSLKFLRKTAWAREKVEKLYIKLIQTKTSSIWNKKSSQQEM
ncbi:MAG: DUF2132 domain-containing protein [Gammaproteobacteria bacterium]|nr:DUF2132 domain-containing protein [Gammaproteobacteria bacterium]